MCRDQAQEEHYICISLQHNSSILTLNPNFTLTQKMNPAMNSSVIISPRVIDTINSLSSADRAPISNALSMEFILGQNPEDTLTPTQSIIYAVIRFYVTQDTARHRERMAKVC